MVDKAPEAIDQVVQIALSLSEQDGELGSFRAAKFGGSFVHSASQQRQFIGYV